MNKFFKWFLAPKTKYELTVTIHLKSGDRLLVPCDNIRLTFTDGNDLTGYTISGQQPGATMYVRIDDISAITYKKNK